MSFDKFGSISTRSTERFLPGTLFCHHPSIYYDTGTVYVSICSLAAYSCINVHSVVVLSSLFDHQSKSRR